MIFYSPRLRAIDINGNPMSGALLWTYVAGTSTLLNSYADVSLSTPHDNPIEADSAGLFPAIWLNGNYKFVLTDSTGNPASGWEVDNVNEITSDDVEFNSYLSLTEKVSQVLHVADYGAVGDGSTDDTAAIQAACTALQGQGGGTLLFDPKTYLIYPTGSLSGSITMNTFTSCRGLDIDGRGAVWSIDDTFAGSEVLTLFLLDGCTHWKIHDFTFDSTPEAVGSATSRGQQIIHIRHATINGQAYNIGQSGGIGGFVCERLANSVEPLSTHLCSNIELTNWACEDVGYPLSFQNNGNRVKVRNFRVVRPGRAYFPYGVREHDIEIDIIDTQTSPSCYMATGIYTDSNYLEDIRLRVSSNDGSSTTQGNLIGLNASVDATTPLAANIRNIRIEFDVTMVTAAALYGVFTLGKVINAVGVDASARGHLIENVSVSGVIRNATDRGDIIDLMVSQGTWTSGETVRGLKIHDLYIEGTGTCAITVDMDPIVDYLVLENVKTPAQLTTQGTAAFGVIHRNTILGPHTRSQAQDSIQTLTGSGEVDVVHDVTYLNTTGGGTYTLPDAPAGVLKTIVMIVDAGDGIVTPGSFIGNPSSTITFNDVGDTAVLRWTSGGWVFLGGTATVA